MQKALPILGEWQWNKTIVKTSFVCDIGVHFDCLSFIAVSNRKTIRPSQLSNSVEGKTTRTKQGRGSRGSRGSSTQNHGRLRSDSRFHDQLLNLLIVFLSLCSHELQPYLGSAECSNRTANAERNGAGARQNLY